MLSLPYRLRICGKFFSNKDNTMRKGFTLIELLVVVLIMGILASVAMPQYFKSVEKSRAAEGLDVMAAIASAQERHYMQKGTYAASLSELDVGISNLTYFTVTHVSENTSNYISIQVRRTENAAGGLGKYYLGLHIPFVPGTGGRTWNCSPLPQCRPMLPRLSSSPY
ncbi:MAG: prepilin-type N-terminal cleavage/methylation domain-containing protein [Elusimicrobiales bacterium]|nr:prepilin-type N-terminal cleavage/methylation domain-containing protein [Elusimicrobiales bacterium]